MHEAVIVSGARTAIGKAPRGTLATVRPDDLGGLVINAAVGRAGGLDPAQIDDLVLGCAIPEGEQGYNLARQAGALAGLPPCVSAQTIYRCCASGLQAIATVAQQIQTGMAEIGVAGGVESIPGSTPTSSWRPTRR